jgi:hypothetical protein
LGGINGGGFAPLVYEVPEMRFRTIVLGNGRDPLEGDGQSTKLPEMPAVRAEVVAPVSLQKRSARIELTGGDIRKVIRAKAAVKKKSLFELRQALE